MLRKAASRACGSLASRLIQNRGHHLLEKRGPLLEKKGSLFENGYQYRSFSSLRQGTRPSFAPSTANGVPHQSTAPRRTLTGVYLYLLAKHPILTKSVTASTIYFFADVGCQWVRRYQTNGPEAFQQWNIVSSLRLAAVGALIAGPGLHIWFNFASKVVPAQNLMGTIKKIAMEQLILCPLTAGVVLSVSFFSKGKSVEDVLMDSSSAFPITFKSDLLYWPICAYFIYRHVPLHLQVLARNLCFAAWSIGFTYMMCPKKNVDGYV